MGLYLTFYDNVLKVVATCNPADSSPNADNRKDQVIQSGYSGLHTYVSHR